MKRRTLMTSIPTLFKGGEMELDSKVWPSEKIPSWWGNSIVVPILKHWSHSDCVSHRDISLISIVSNLPIPAILRKLWEKYERQIRKKEAGFGAGRGRVERIFTLKQVLRDQRSLCSYTFAQPKTKSKTMCVDEWSLWEVYIGPRRVILHSSGLVMVYTQLSSPSDVFNRMWQQCSISPFLLYFPMKHVLRNDFSGLLEDKVDLLPGNRVFDLECVSDITWFNDKTDNWASVL